MGKSVWSVAKAVGSVFKAKMPAKTKRSIHSKRTQPRATDDVAATEREKGVGGMWPPVRNGSEWCDEGVFVARPDSSVLTRVEATSAKYVTELCEVGQTLVIEMETVVMKTAVAAGICID